MNGEGVLTRDGVEENEVLKVGDFPTLPTLGHVGRFEQLLWCRQGDSPIQSNSATHIKTIVVT